MSDVTYLVALFFGSAIATYLFWFICHYNGNVIYYFICAASHKISSHKDLSPLGYLNNISTVKLSLIGATPLALLSISTSLFNRCFNSVYLTSILEIAIMIAFLLVPYSVKKQLDLFGFHGFRKNPGVLLYTGLWLFIFAVWVVLNQRDSLDYILSNTNPDMWAYVRRFAAMTTDNLRFHGGTDSFVFSNNSACAFFLGSPKKFSSFLGSLVIYPFERISLGIGVFQGMLGSLLFISLFQDWFKVRLSKRTGISLGKIALMIWALFSPPIYWLLVNAYFSNTLFIIISCSVFRETRKAAISSQIDTIENWIYFISVLIIVFSFYPAFLPLIVLAYLSTILIYLPRQDLTLNNLYKIGFKFGVIIVGCALIFFLFFKTQLGLYEVQKSINPLKIHGSNFVPLNPWSLLQEKPKPMPFIRDFGWYFQLTISFPLSVFLGWKIWQKYRVSQDRDLLAGLVGIGLYIGYLLAFIPLESTYRLMKIAISFIYPLAIFSLLPLVLWCQKRLAERSNWIRKGVFILAIAHVIFHVEKVFDLNSFPAGSFVITNQTKLENIQNLVIVGCDNVHESQFYERLVGLQVARKYPHLSVDVFHASEGINDSLRSDLVISGKTTLEPIKEVNYCRFRI